MELSERKMQILRAIVDDYIASGIPVGSRTISKMWGGALSPATIRNEMSDLYEMGFLGQPYTSAGRTPSEKAYRYYVDRLLRVPGIDREEIEGIQRYFSGRMEEIGEILTAAVKTLSQATSYAGIAMAPELSGLQLKQIRLIPVTKGRALCVIVTNLGFVNDLVITIPEEVDAASLNLISNILTEKMQGRFLSELPYAMGGISEQMRYHSAVFQSLVEALRARNSTATARSIVYDGAQNLFQYPEFTDIERARTLLTALEQRDTLYTILNQASTLSLHISIGMETGMEDLKETSVVTATYSVEGEKLGTFGVIGPMRMNYSRVVSVMESLGVLFVNMSQEKK